MNKDFILDEELDDDLDDSEDFPLSEEEWESEE